MRNKRGLFSIGELNLTEVRAEIEAASASHALVNGYKNTDNSFAGIARNADDVGKKSSQKARCLGIAGIALACLCMLMFAFAFLSGAAARLIDREYAEAANGAGAVVIEATTGRVLYKSDENRVLYPASTTKVLTALVILDTMPLNMQVKIDSRAVGVEGSSVYLKAGEVLTIEELLYCLMLRSGNDSAVALALAVCKNLNEFAILMNKKAAECGALSSNFVNPHGLHNENHYTTAYDLAMITRAAFLNAGFRKIVAAKRVYVGKGATRRYLINKNKLLDMFEGANGVKTGFTTKSGRCLVGAAKRDGMQLISVVLNHGDMWNDTMHYMNDCFKEYYMCPTAMTFADNEAKSITVHAKFDENGDINPIAYPIRKNGSESIKLVFSNG